MTDRILILDFGSQVTQLIARRVRENGVYCEIHPYTIGEATVRDLAPRGIILSGGPASVTGGAAPRAPDIVFRLGVPVLGICYGMQTMCDELGGRVTLSEHQEFGRAFIDILDDCLLFEGLWPKGARRQVWMSHGDNVDALPAGFRVVARSEAAPFAAIADDSRTVGAKGFASNFSPFLSTNRQITAGSFVIIDSGILNPACLAIINWNGLLSACKVA
jgi:GMP synthase (glutamine-hydrolysing)